MKPIIQYCDLSTLTFSGSVVSYNDPANLNSYDPNSRWISATTDGNQYLLMSSSASITCNALSVLRHNFASVMNTGSILLECADSQDFATGYELILNDLQTETGATVFRTFAPTTKQYWRIKYSGSLNDVPYLGNVFLSEYMQFPYTYEWGNKTYNSAFVTAEKTNLAGTIVTAQAYSGRKVHEVTFKYLTNEFKNAFIDFLSMVRGKLYPYIFIDTNGELSYCINDNDYNPTTAKKYNLNETQLLKLKATTTDMYTSVTVFSILETNEYITEVI